MPLLVAQLFGAFNDQFLKQALIALVIFGNMDFWGLDDRQSTGVATILLTLPFFLLSALAGQVADKYDKAVVLRKVKFCEIFIMGLAAIGFLLQSTFLLCLTLVFMGAQSAFFSPSRNSVLPQWMKKHELLAANGLMGGFLYLTILVGQIAGNSLILTEYGAQIAAVLLLVFAVLGWRAICLAPPAPSGNTDIKLNFNIVYLTWDTLVFASKTPRVFKPLLGTAWFYGIGAAVFVVMPPYVKEILHYDQTVFELVMVIFALGAVIGALLCAFLTKGGNGLSIALIGICGLAIFCFDLYITGGDNSRAMIGTRADFLASPEAPRFMIDLLGAAISGSMFVVPMNAMAQARAPKLYSARLLAAGAILLNGATTGTSALILGMNKLNLPLKTPFLVIAIVNLFIGAYLFKKWRYVRQNPEEF